MFRRSIIILILIVGNISREEVCLVFFCVFVSGVGIFSEFIDYDFLRLKLGVEVIAIKDLGGWNVGLGAFLVFLVWIGLFIFF